MFKLSRQKTINKTTSIRTRSGATSLYVVVFASLLFSIIAIGFVSIIMSELTQTVNAELSQSAYDSALAGIEDAKLAIMKCQGSDRSGCEALNTEVGDSNENYGCNTVATILGRDHTGTDVSINETGAVTEASGETLQSYTCVTIKNKLPDYRSYLSSSDTDTMRIVPIRTASVDGVTGIRISWYAATDNNDFVYRNINTIYRRASFAPISSGISAPPTISVKLIQTDSTFTLDSKEIDYSVRSNTDRGTLFLVPIQDQVNRSLNIAVANNHISNSGTTNNQTGVVPNVSLSTNSGFTKSNDKAQTNYPYVISCETEIGAEFACSATIELPKPVAQGGGISSGTRNSTTAFLAISMPYDRPSTDFAIELCNDTGRDSDTDGIRGNCSTTVDFDNVQYSVDSTGRANDVYNRVEARLELADIYFPYPEYAVQLTGSGNTLLKKFWATSQSCWYSNDGVRSNCPTNHLSGLLYSH